MAIYSAVCSNCGLIELLKPMSEPFPATHGCGGRLTRVYHVTPVQYRAAGFRDYDDGLRKKVGKERYAKFEAKRKQILDATPRGAAIDED
jgi:predicted nucleic acid-binding Zn ribbon protein